MNLPFNLGRQAYQWSSWAYADVGGSESIYNNLWLRGDVQDMADFIHSLNIANKTAYHSYLQAYLAPQMQPEEIALQILTALGGEHID